MQTKVKILLLALLTRSAFLVSEQVQQPQAIQAQQNQQAKNQFEQPMITIPASALQYLQPVFMNNQVAQLPVTPSQQKVSKKNNNDDDDIGPRILECFATRLVPAFVQMVAGAESGDNQQEVAGIKNFAAGVFEFLTYATRHPEQFEALIESLETENLTEEQIYQTTRSLVGILKDSVTRSKKGITSDEELSSSENTIIL